MNDRPLSKEPLKTVSSYIRQKQPTTYRRKVLNLHKVVINFSLSNTKSILVNSCFGSISFANNENNWENSTPGTIYQRSDQTSDIGTNIECNLVKEGLQKGKKQWLTLEKKQTKVAKKEATKL